MSVGAVSLKKKTAYEIRPRDWSSGVCSSDLCPILWKRRNCELPANQRRAAERMWKACLDHLTPGPLRLIGAETLSQRIDCIVVRRAQHIGVTRKLLRQPHRSLFHKNPI